MDQSARPYDALEVAPSPPQPYPELLPYHDRQPTYAHAFSVENSVPQKSKTWRRVPWYFLGLVALLGAVVVGLAAGVGVEARRANHAEALLAAEAALSANRTSSQNGTSSPNGTSSQNGTSSTDATTYDAIDRNCSSNAPTVTGTTYASFPLNGDVYTIYCFEYAMKTQLMSLFTHDFDSCMDACSSYNRYTASLQLVDQKNNSLLCGAVTFAPPWTNKTTASAVNIDGNCFLKEPQTAAEFWKATIVSDYHSALRNN